MLKESVRRWEQEFIQTGIEQGLEQGLEQGQVKVIVRLVEKRFGQQQPEFYQKLENATPEQLEEWSLNILEATSAEDLFKH